MKRAMMAVVSVLVGWASAHAEPPKRFVIGDEVLLDQGVVGCTWDQIKALEQIAASRDMVAYRALLGRAFASQTCRILQPGLRVIVGKGAWISNAVEVRVKGDPVTWWAVTGMLQEAGRKVN